MPGIKTKSFFFVLEGIDGSGKSTQAKLLGDFLEQQGIAFQELREPTSGRWGQEIKRILQTQENVPKEELLHLFLRDREEDVKKNILPALEKKQSIVMDRYYFSNLAYQGAMGLKVSDIWQENRKRNFPEPDRVYYIDLLPETAMARINLRSNLNKQPQEIFEKENFLKKVREIYLQLESDNFRIIKGDQSPLEVFQIIKKDLLNFF